MKLTSTPPSGEIKSEWSCTAVSHAPSSSARGLLYLLHKNIQNKIYKIVIVLRMIWAGHVIQWSIARALQNWVSYLGDTVGNEIP